MKGSGPRRRTVLTVPEFDWVVDLLEHWISPAAANCSLPQTGRGPCGPLSGPAPRVCERSSTPSLGPVSRLACRRSSRVHSTDLPVRHRAIAILLLVFGQPLERLITLTWDDLTLADTLVTIRLGGTADIELHPPLDEPFRQLAAEPQNHQTAAHPNSNWVFPGYSPATIELHARGSAANYTSYLKARLDAAPH